MLRYGVSIRVNLTGACLTLALGCNALTGQVRVGDTGAGTQQGTACTPEGGSSNNDDGAQDEDETNTSADEAPCSGSEFVSPIGLPTGVVTIGEHVFNVEISDTPEALRQGLMDRKSLAADAGMLFIFDQAQILSFWMLNTLLPLDIAFIRSDLIISSTDTMEPLTTTQHVSIEPALYALEVPAGEFARRGIVAGDVVLIAQNEQAASDRARHQR